MRCCLNIISPNRKKSKYLRLKFPSDCGIIKVYPVRKGAVTLKKILKLKKRYLIPSAVILLMIFLNILARLCRPFADFYVFRVFPYISSALSFVSGIFPFSVGEVLIILGILIAVIGVPLTAGLLIFRKSSRRRTAGIFMTCFMWILCYICTTETMNCFIMYQCTPFAERYLRPKEHPRSELIALYAALIDEANRLAPQVPRDSDDRFYLTADFNEEARKAMKAMGEKYPQLKGYYPRAKAIKFSFFMSQTHLSGIYFPFSMESNYNADMVDTNLPDTICHEFSHLKGIIQEDEANFIAYLATMNSDNIEFRYSGCLEGLEYVHNQIYKNDIEEAYYLTDTISDQVRRDWFRFLPDNYWEENEKKEIINTETVNTVSEAALDTNIKMNGREDGVEAYSQMVTLLLDYYFPAEE